MSEVHPSAELEPVTLGDLVEEPVADGVADVPDAPPLPDSPAEGWGGITPPRRRGGAARFITDVVVDLGFLPKERVDGAVEEARATGSSPEEILLKSGALSADQLARATAERFGLDHVDLTVYKPDIDRKSVV